MNTILVAKITEKSELNEEQLRKTQAATIIAKALNYVPENWETPSDIVTHAIENCKEMSMEQIAIVKEMLTLAEDVGIKEDEHDDFTEEELDKMVASVDLEDLLDVYEPGDLHIEDEETGEVVDDLKDELKEDTINEVLSRSERIRAKVRFSKSSSKRERKLKIALTTRSTAEKINKRARAMAIKLVKTRLAKKPLTQLSVADKERVERQIASRKKLINRLAMKMAIRVRKIEKERLTSKKTK